METLYVDTNRELDIIVRNYNIHAYDENLKLGGMTLDEFNYLSLGIYIGQLIEIREILLTQRAMQFQKDKTVISPSKLLELLNRIELEKSKIVKHAVSIKISDI
jgi:hypothetical protein